MFQKLCIEVFLIIHTNTLFAAFPIAYTKGLEVRWIEGFFLVLYPPHDTHLNSQGPDEEINILVMIIDLL